MLVRGVSLHDPEVRREIEAAVAEAVSRFGAAGEARIEGTRICLIGAGPEVSTELGPLPEHWPMLAPEIRMRRVTALARTLVEARRSLLAPAARSGFRMPRFVAPLAILALAVVALGLAWKFLTPGWFGGRQNASAAVSVDEYERQRVERAERVCRATRSRVQRGATIGPTDSEGWVVEIVLARSGDDPKDDARLGDFFGPLPDAGGRRVIWKDAPELASLEGIDTEVEVAAEPMEPGAERAVRLTFKGKYVAPYFNGGDRRAYVKLANALAETLNITTGALYARCAQSSTHELGSWFLGADPGATAASLVFFVGAFNDPPQVRESILLPSGGTDIRASGALGRIRERAKSLERNKVRDLAGLHDGAISTTPAGKTALTFPFNDANRAARASYELAKAAGVGLER